MQRVGIFVPKHPDGRKYKTKKSAQAQCQDGVARCERGWIQLEHET